MQNKFLVSIERRLTEISIEINYTKMVAQLIVPTAAWTLQKFGLLSERDYFRNNPLRKSLLQREGQNTVSVIFIMSN